jgi:hypothetical protein
MMNSPVFCDVGPAKLVNQCAFRHSSHIHCLISHDALRLPAFFFEWRKSCRIAYLQPSVLAAEAVESRCDHVLDAVDKVS